MTGSPNIDPNISAPVSSDAISDTSTTPVQTSQPTTSDTISQSDEIASLVYLYSAAMPTLQPPENSQDLQTIAATGITAKMVADFGIQYNDEATQKMMSGWSNQIQQDAAIVRERVIPNNTLQDRIQHNLILTRNAGVEATSSLANNNSAEGAAVVGFMAGSLAIGSGMIVEFTPIVDAAGTQQLVPSVSPNLVAEAMPAFQGVIADPSLTAQIGFISGMIAAGAFSTVIVPNLFKTIENGGKEKPKELARDFAQRILNLVGDKNFDQHILFRTVDRMPGTEKLPEKAKMQMVAVIKVILLATALAALYQNETGWLGPEVENLLTGDFEGFFQGKPEEKELREGIGLQLQAAYRDLSDEQQERIQKALVRYFQSEPELNQLSNFEHTFEAVAHQMDNKEIPA